MGLNGDDTKSLVKRTSFNLNIIIEVQQKWDYVLKSKTEIIKTKNRAVVLKIYDHLTDYLTQLESVQEVNPRLADLKRNLIEEISKFHSYIRDVALKRKSLVMPFGTPTKASLLSEVKSDYLEASGPHTVFVDSKEISSGYKVPVNMRLNGDDTKSLVKRTSFNLNIIIEVQQKWDYVLKSKTEIIKTKNRAVVLKIYDHLTDYLTQLESVQEVNPRLADLKRNLIEEISKFHSYIRDVALKRKSLVMPFGTPTKASLLSEVKSDYLEASGPHTVFVDSKEISSGYKVPVNMRLNGDDTKSLVKRTSFNLNIIIEVQQKWDYVLKSKTEIIKTKNRAVVLKIYDHLTDYLTQLESVQEVNPRLADLKRNLIEEISKFHSYIRDVALKRKSLVMPFGTPTKASLLSEVKSDYLEASGPHTVFVDSKEISSGYKVPVNMRLNGDDTKSLVKRTSFNLNIIIEVQQKWDYVLKSKTEIIKTKNRAVVLKIYDHLTDYLTQLESVQEVNPRLADLKRNLIEEISKFHSYIRDVALKRKSLVMPFGTPTKASLLSEVKSDYLEASGPHTVFVDSKEISSGYKVPVNMRLNGDDTKSLVKRTSFNLNIIIEVQQKWDYVLKSKTEIIKTKNRAVVLKIYDHLTDYLTQLESVQEVNPRLADLKRNLIEEISKFHSYIRDVALKRKSLVMPFGTPTKASLLSEVKSDYLEASGPHTVFVDSKEISSDLHDKLQMECHKDVRRYSNEMSTTQYRKNKSFICRLSKLFQIFVTCGSAI